MRIVYKAPNHTPFECEVPNTLNVLQSLVGGDIEILELDNGVDIIVNEKGMLLNMPLNNVLYFKDIAKEIPLYGAMILCSTDGEDFASLDDEQFVYALDVCEIGVV